MDAKTTPQGVTIARDFTTKVTLAVLMRPFPVAWEEQVEAGFSRI